MQLSQTVEYALRAAVWLAGRTAQPQTTAQIAAGTQVPASYLSKVLQSMGRASLVTGQRGIGGGFILARPPEQISLLEVVEAVEPFQRITRCPLGIGAHVDLCPLHRKLDAAFALVQESFATTRLSELVARDELLHPLCPPAPLPP